MAFAEYRRGLEGSDLTRNPGLSNTMVYGTGEIPLPTRPTTRAGVPMSSKPTSMFRSQQTEEANPDTTRLAMDPEEVQNERV